MIVPASLVVSIRQLAVDLAGPSAEGMWTTAVGPTADAEPTHYISSGMIESQFADLLDSPAGLAELTGMTFEQADSLLASCIVAAGEPHAVMSAHGLVLTAAPEEVL